MPPPPSTAWDSKSLWRNDIQVWWLSSPGTCERRYLAIFRVFEVKYLNQAIFRVFEVKNKQVEYLIFNNFFFFFQTTTEWLPVGSVNVESPAPSTSCPFCSYQFIHRKAKMKCLQGNFLCDHQRLHLGQAETLPSQLVFFQVAFTERKSHFFLPRLYLSASRETKT